MKDKNVKNGLGLAEGSAVTPKLIEIGKEIREEIEEVLNRDGEDHDPAFSPNENTALDEEEKE